MKKLVFLCCFILLATNSFAEKGWHVEWYRIKRPSNEYGEFLGEENWSNINFNRSWKTNYVYGDIKDYVGFIATTTIHSNGGKYEFKLFNVDDTASLFLDGKKILETNYKDSINVTVSKGEHTLRIEWKEYCCGASIGFFMSEPRYKEEKLYGIVIAFLIGISVAIVLLLLKIRKRK